MRKVFRAAEAKINAFAKSPEDPNFSNYPGNDFRESQPSLCLQALRIVRTAERARAPRSASGAASETNAAALSVLGNRAARCRTRSRGGGRRSGSLNGRARGFRSGAGA